MDDGKVKKPQKMWKGNFLKNWYENNEKVKYYLMFGEPTHSMIFLKNKSEVKITKCITGRVYL